MAEAAAVSLMTAEEFAALPEDGRRYELVGGRLIEVSPSSSRSSILARRLGTRIDLYATEHNLGVVGDADWGMRLTDRPDSVRAPDIGFVRAERIPTEGIPAGFWPGPPDLALEVISPSDRFSDVMAKVDEYLAAGTRLVWLFDPERRTVRGFRAGGSSFQLGADGVLSGEDVLPGFELPLAGVWV